VSLAKGGGGGGGGGSGVAPTVTSTNPSFAFQDTTIDVSIFGSDFTNGASAAWSVNGNTSHVQVKSTKFVSATELKASIVIPAAAPVAKYDVVVTLSNGKKGVGAEKFEVLLGDPTAAYLFPLDDAALDVKSDRQFTSGGNSVYGDGVCGVGSKIFATEAASNSGDATMQTNNPTRKDRKCAAYPRKLTVVFGPGDQQTSAVFINTRHIQNTTYSLPIGFTDRHILNINEARCDGLRWTRNGAGGEFLGGDSVNVTRVDASTWLVESQPYPNNKAYCNNTGQLHHLNVRFTVVANRPMP
jgi:hypothetical protein